MKRFPNILRLAEDEDLASYLARTAEANGMTLNELLTLFSQPTGRTVNINASIIQALDVADPLQFYLDTTILPFQLFFQQEPQMAYRITPLLKRSGDPLYSGVLEQFVPRNLFRLCPQCVESELTEHGFFYYHREHQIPSVHVCRIHGSVLLEQPGIKTRLFQSTRLKPCVSDVLPDELGFASFCHDLGLLLREHAYPKVELSQLQDFVYRNLGPGTRCLNTREKIQVIEDRLTSSGLGAIISRDPLKIHSAINAWVRNEPSCGLTLLLIYMCTRSSYNEFISLFTESPLRTELCPVCGYRYPVSPTLKRYSIGCPCQHTQTSEEFLCGLFQRGVFPDYELKEVRPDRNKMTFLHVPSGNVVERGIPSFLFYNSRINAQRRLSTEQIADIIRSTSGGALALYDLNKTQKTYTVICSKCGKTRSYKGTAYSHVKNCQYCKKQQI